MKSNTPVICLLLLFAANQASSQTSDTTTAQVEPVINDNQVSFNASLRPLRTIAGAPAAFYSYFWEFGDGAYSFEKQPVHVYADTGNYQVRLYATNNYDDGKKPPTRPTPVKVTNRSMIAANKKPSFFSGTGS